MKNPELPRTTKAQRLVGYAFGTVATLIVLGVVAGAGFRLVKWVWGF